MCNCAWCYEPVDDVDKYEVAGLVLHNECKDYLTANPDCWPTVQCDGLQIPDDWKKEETG